MNAEVQMRLDEPETSQPFLQFRDEEMQNPRFTLLVYLYLLGQFRVVLTDRDIPDIGVPAGHGSIVQVMCTYQSAKLAEVITALRHAPDPLELARSWARPYNCEFSGDRIRLDNRPKDRPETTRPGVKATV